MKKIISAILLSLILSVGFGANAQAAYKVKVFKCDFNAFYEKFCNNWQGNVPSLPEENEPETPEIEEPELPEENINAHEYELRVLELVNEERAKRSLSPLSWSDELAEVARAHSEDMLKRNFFSHTNPDGKSPFDRMRAYGISYRSAGENIAAGQKTPEAVVEAWMNSEGHRANILNSSYTKLGVGYVSGNGAYGTYWTQNFAG